MATFTFTHPKFSFLNNTLPSFNGNTIEAPECITPINLCYPMSRFFNVAFQVYVNTFGDPIPFINHNRFVVYPVKGTDCERPDNYFNAPGTTPPPIIMGNTYTNALVTDYDVEVIGDVPSPYAGVINFMELLYEDFDEWNALAPEEWRIELGDCFHLQVYQVGWNKEDGEVTLNPGNPLICSPCFIRTEECYNTVIAYNNNENNYGFFFMSSDSGYDDFIAKIELPFYLKNPQLPSEESSYRKSDGKYIKLSERIEEEYSLETDWWLHDWHRKFKVALGCDSVQMNNPNIRQQAYQIPDGTGGLALDVICKEPYEIEWDEDVPGGYLLIAKAKTKVKMSEAVSYINSNCV